MILLDNISKIYGEKILFQNLTYQFPVSERISIVGPNGAGKSTLIEILCGLREPDTGRVIKPESYKLGFLPQSPNPTPKPTVLAEVLSGAGWLSQLRERLALLVEKMHGQSNEQLIAEYDRLETEFRSGGGYSLEANCKKILAGLGFTLESMSADPMALSGGWRMRVELAKLLVQAPDVLLLDEPTNHLDLPSLVWFETFLRSYSGTLIFISHDRDLLDKLSTVTVYLNQGNLQAFKGNFSQFLEQLEQQQETARRSLAKVEKQSAQLEVFINRFRAKATKARQVQSRIKTLNQLETVAQQAESQLKTNSKNLVFQLPPPPRSPRVMADFRNVSIGYADKAIATDISLLLERGQKIGVVGANGLGKTTLLKTLVGVLPAVSGTLTLGEGVKIGYFSQSHEKLTSKGTSLLNHILQETPLGESEARHLLGAFLFSGDDVKKSPDVLSGGEKSRLALATILAHSVNLLILDEPTNHLDMSSVEALSLALEAYEGTVVTVSHDRRFINDLCSHLIIFAQGHRPWLAEGNLDDYEYLASRGEVPNIFESGENSADSKVKEKPKPTNSGEISAINKEKQKQFKQLSKKQLQLEEDISNRQVKIAELETDMLTHATDPSKCRDLSNAYATLKEELESLEMEWLELSEKMEGLKP